jgi:hypothetical protein
MNDLIPLPSFQELEAKALEIDTYLQRANEIGGFILSTLERHRFDFIQPALGRPGSLDIETDRIPFDGSLGLRFNGLLPDSFLTPVGKVKITGVGIEGDSKKAYEILKVELGLVEVSSESGHDGPAIYAVTRDIHTNPFSPVNPNAVLLKGRGEAVIFDENGLPLLSGILSPILPKITRKIDPKRIFEFGVTPSNRSSFPANLELDNLEDRGDLPPDILKLLDL